MPHRQSQSQLNVGRRREAGWIPHMTPHSGSDPKSDLYGYICSHPGTLGFWPRRYWRKLTLLRSLFCERNCIGQEKRLEHRSRGSCEAGAQTLWFLRGWSTDRGSWVRTLPFLFQMLNSSILCNSCTWPYILMIQEEIEKYVSC